MLCHCVCARLFGLECKVEILIFHKPTQSNPYSRSGARYEVKKIYKQTHAHTHTSRKSSCLTSRTLCEAVVRGKETWQKGEKKVAKSQKTHEKPCFCFHLVCLHLLHGWGHFLCTVLHCHRTHCALPCGWRRKCCMHAAGMHLRKRSTTRAVRFVVGPFLEISTSLFRCVRAEVFVCMCVSCVALYWMAQKEIRLRCLIWSLALFLV